MRYDLKGLYVITDKRLINRQDFIKTVGKSLKGGAKILQLREKDTDYDEIVYIGKQLLRLTTKYNVPLIINDFPEISLEIGAQGVHLGESDTSVTDARKLLGDKAIIGVSCYGIIERGIEALNRGADYLAFGTPYQTPTKPGRKPTPFTVLKEARRKFNNIPLFAIGGITGENISDVLSTGVDGVAVITSVFGATDTEGATRLLAEYFE